MTAKSVPVFVGCRGFTGDDYAYVALVEGAETEGDDALLHVDAGVAKRWRDATTVAFAARDAFIAAQDTWKQAFAVYERECGNPISEAVDASEEAEREVDAAAEAEASQARRVVVDAERALETAALDAEDGPAVFYMGASKKNKAPSNHFYGRNSPVHQTLHLTGCRYLDPNSLYPVSQAIRATEATQMLTRGASACGTCKPVVRLLSVNPALAGALDSIQAERDAVPRVVTASSVRQTLESVINSFFVSKTTGDGHTGFKAESDFREGAGCILLRQFSPGVGQTAWYPHNLKDAVEALLATNVHLELGAENAGHSEPAFKELLVSGTSPAEDKEALYATLDPKLLYRAMRMNISTREALVLARNGDFTETAVATLEALRKGATDMQLVTA